MCLTAQGHAQRSCCARPYARWTSAELENSRNSKSTQGLSPRSNPGASVHTSWWGVHRRQRASSRSSLETALGPSSWRNFLPSHAHWAEPLIVASWPKAARCAGLLVRSWCFAYRRTDIIRQPPAQRPFRSGDPAPVLGVRARVPRRTDDDRRDRLADRVTRRSTLRCGRWQTSYSVNRS